MNSIKTSHWNTVIEALFLRECNTSFQTDCMFSETDLTEDEIKSFITEFNLNPKNDFLIDLYHCHKNHDGIVDITFKSFVKQNEDEVMWQAYVYETHRDLGIKLHETESWYKPMTKEKALKKAKKKAKSRDFWTYGKGTGIHYGISPVMIPYSEAKVA